MVEINQSTLGWIAAGTLTLTAFGYAYGRIVVWLLENHNPLLIGALLALTPVGIGGVLAVSAFLIGIQAALVILIALGVAGAPVIWQVGRAWLHSTHQPRIG